MSWNDRQQKAIDMRGRSVVVSAAAGSGKTSVLTERVLRLIEEGADLERMLIVTFTNLAAGEMKERIFRRLQEAGGARLAAQAEKCAFADISTIHAFCARVIRDNFIEAGVSPSFSVADEASISSMKERAMEEAADSAAQDKANLGFISRFSPRGDMKSIKDTAFAMYNRVISLKDPLSWLDCAASNFDSEVFIETLFNEYKGMVCEAAAEAETHLILRTAAWRERGYTSEAGESEKQRINIARAAERPDIKNVFVPQAVNISSNEKGAPNGESKTHTGRANKALSGLEAYTGDFASKVKAELSAVRGDALAFISITKNFMAVYTALKRRKNVLDHDDLIHFALKALSVPGIAKRYQEKYAHVFVDEYQDINDAQNAILQSVQRGGNDFLVGDAKQCIYMFRESNPELLTARCAELKQNGLIEMNANYRSEPKVIEFINGVMGSMMDENAGGVTYSGGQALECSTCGEGAAEIVIAGKEELSGAAAEGAAIASIIKELLYQGFEYKDIAVLRPEVSSSGRFIAKALTDAGIPVISGSGETGEKFGEPGVFLNLVSLIESPGSDIALLSVMRYPHFGFTEPEFARIRLAQKDDTEDKSFYSAACSYDVKDELAEKLRSFFNEIGHYRLLSQSLKLPDFLMRLRLEAEFEEYALTSPAGKIADNAITSLIDAIAAMNDVRLADVPDIARRIGAAKQQLRPGETDAVYLTTIHKSKGLEFPVVILSGMHKNIDQRDSRGAVLVGRSLGLALDIINENSRVRTQTLHRLAVQRRMREEVISETVRLLYVGMTRAGKRLILTGAGDGMKDKWFKEKRTGWQFEAVTYFDLIMPAAAKMCAKDGKDICDIVRTVNGGAAEEEKTDKAQMLKALFEEAENAAEADLFEVYAHKGDLGVPSKVSVSAIKRLNERAPEVTVTPQYMPDESGLSAAEKGTLTHKVLQKSGLAKMSAEETGRFIKELISEGILDIAGGEALDENSIAGLLNSDIAQRARESSKMLLEAPFCLSLGAKELGLADSNESVILQGVIDMCFIERGGWVIVDYKTDRVNGNCNEAALKYRIQLSLYAKALESITGMRVREKYIYFISSGIPVLLP